MNDENMKEPVPVQDADVGTAADVEAVMKKYDRESNVRIWEGIPLLIIRWLSVGFSIYCIYNTVQHCTSGGSSDHFPRNDSDSGLPELSDQKGGYPGQLYAMV